MITALGPILRGDGSTFIGRMKLKALWSPAALNGDPVLPAIVTVNCAAPDGGFAIVGNPDAANLTLAPGTWQVTFPSAPEVPAIYLAVPDADDQIPFAELMTPGAEEAELLNPRYGAGSPEGVITAGLSRLYWDTLNKAFWIKDTAGGNVGWRSLIE